MRTRVPSPTITDLPREDDVYTTVLDGEPQWGPLERLAGELRVRGWLPRPDDFLYVGREVATDRPDIHLYKAMDTRRYLNLDDHGCAYWCVSQPSTGLIEPEASVDYVPVPDIVAALRWARA